MKIGLFHVLKNSEGPNKGPNPTLSQLAGRLIERWDSMTDKEKMVIQFFIDSDEMMESLTPDPAESAPD